MKQIADAMQSNPKCKKVKLTVNNIKEHLHVFINSTIEDPSFNSQTKEQLSNNLSKKWQDTNKYAPKLDQQFMTEFLKQGILDVVVE